jgi:hypothetical protein
LYWDNDGTNLQQEKQTVGILLLSTSTCTWDNDGTANLQPPENKLLGFTFNNLLVLGQ